MTNKDKLKTLKDIQETMNKESLEHYKSQYFILKADIKREAIKWVKQEREDSPETWIAMTDLMVRFHNITEEDLNER